MMADKIEGGEPSNVIKFPHFKYDALLFPVKSREFEILAKIVGRYEARLIQHLEFLFSDLGALAVPHGRIYRHIEAPKKFPKSPCLLKYMGGSVRTLYRKLNNIRSQHRYQAGVQFDDEHIDCEGKYYKSAYENSDKRQDPHAERNLYWYRNAPLLHDLNEQVKAGVKAKTKPNSPAKMVCGGDKLAGELSDELAGECAGELAGDKSCKELKEPKELEEPKKSEHKTENRKQWATPKTPKEIPPMGLEENQNPEPLFLSGGSEQEKEIETVETVSTALKPEASEYANGLNKYSSPYDVYRFLIHNNYGVFPTYTDGIKKKLNRLRITYDTYVANDQLGGDPPHFYEFLAVMVQEWKHIHTYYFNTWNYLGADSEIPDAIGWSRSGGKVVVDWYAECYLTGAFHQEQEFQAKQYAKFNGA